MVKIYKVRGCDVLSVYDIERVNRRLQDVDYFVYNYADMGYDGSGFAVWKKDDKYGYTNMGHCSCNGPLDDLNSIYYTLPELKKLVENEYYDDYAKEVYARIESIEAKLSKRGEK